MWKESLPATKKSFRGGEGKRDGRAMEPVREACEFPAPARKRRFLHRAYTLRIGSFLLRHDRAPEPAQRKRRPFQARSASITAGEEGNKAAVFLLSFR